MACRAEAPVSSTTTQELGLVCDSLDGVALAWYICGNDPSLQIDPADSNDASCIKLELQIRKPAGVEDAPDGDGSTGGSPSDDGFVVSVDNSTCNPPACTSGDFYMTPIDNNGIFYAELSEDKRVNYTLPEGALTPAEGDAQGLVGWISDFHTLSRLRLTSASSVATQGGYELHCSRPNGASGLTLSCDASGTSNFLRML